MREGAEWVGLGFIGAYDSPCVAAADEYLQKATLYFEEQSRLHPDDDYSWNRLGRAYSRGVGKSGRAEEAYKRATELSPKTEQYWGELADFLTQQGRLGDAVSVCRAAVQANPDSWKLLGTLGWALAQKQDTTNAEEAYRRSIAINPRSSNAIEALGELKLESGKTDEGIDLLRQATTLEGWNSSAWPTLLRAEFESNSISASELIERTGRWLDENHRSPTLLNSISWQLAQTRRREILPFAESLAREATTRDSDWEYVDTLCFILIIQQRWGDALNYVARLFDHAFESGAAIQASIRFAIAAAASGYPEEVMQRLRTSKGRAALEPLETGIRQFLGQDVVAPKEIAEIAHDIAERIRAYPSSREPKMKH